MKIRMPIAIALASTMIVACGGGSASPNPTRQTLDGRTFLSTRVDGPALVGGTEIRISFQDGGVSVNAGCNTFGGRYRIAGNTLTVTEIGTTEMACAPNLMAQDQWIAGLLGGGTLSLAGNELTLAASGIRVIFLDRVVADPDRPLVGTRWVVDGLISGGAASSVPGGVAAAITFSDAHMDIETGCNTGGAAVTIADASITVSELVLTKKACLGPGASLEDAVVAVLRGPMSYKIEADVLTLQTGALGLTLRAAP